MKVEVAAIKRDAEHYSRQVIIFWSSVYEDLPISHTFIWGGWMSQLQYKGIISEVIKFDIWLVQPGYQ